MNGAVFAQQARRFAPATPILFVTGYADLEWTSKAPADGLLKKPFTRAQIAEKLRTLLRPATRDEPGGPWPTPPSQSQLST
jgi:FixJ family two-component response regulator